MRLTAGAARWQREAAALPAVTQPRSGGRDSGTGCRPHRVQWRENPLSRTPRRQNPSRPAALPSSCRVVPNHSVSPAALLLRGHRCGHEPLRTCCPPRRVRPVVARGPSDAPAPRSVVAQPPTAGGWPAATRGAVTACRRLGVRGTVRRQHGRSGQDKTELRRHGPCAAPRWGQIASCPRPQNVSIRWHHGVHTAERSSDDDQFG